MNILKLTLGVKVFFAYLILSSGIAWYLIDATPTKLSKGIDKAAEEVMIDTANLLAQSVSFDINNNTITIETAEPIPIFDTANPCLSPLIGNVKVPEAPPVNRNISSNLLKFQINLIMNKIDKIAVICGRVI